MDLMEDPQEIARFAVSEEGTRDTLGGELDSLLSVAPLDCAIAWILCDDTLIARAARGPLASPTLEKCTIPLSRWQEVCEAIESRRPRVGIHTGEASSAEASPMASLIDLPGAHTWAVAPLVLSGRAVGALTVARAGDWTLEQAAVDLIETYARLLSLALHNTAQHAALFRVRSNGEERVSLLEAELGSQPGVALETSLSPAMLEVAWKARQVAPTDTPVLILGETGTGKEWLARAIHRASARTEHPFVKINCAAIAAGVLESELFGHVKGAFTGATRDRPGRFQIAHRGTLLLDEIGEIPMELQAKLLRVLQEGTLFPVGSDRQVKVDVRILAATHVDLERAIAKRLFREDLYYRMSVFPLKMPPLRDRLEDMPRLTEVLLEAQAARTARKGMRVTPEGLDKLCAYDWPGNVRELANVLERATILARTKDLGPEVLDLPEHSPLVVRPTSSSSAPPPEAPSAVLTLDGAQRIHIQRALVLTGGRIYGVHGAARLLGMKPSTLQSRMKKLGIARVMNADGTDHGLNEGLNEGPPSA